MEAAIDYAREKEYPIEQLQSINHIRLWKRINLPIELASSNRQLEILYFKDDLAIGPIRWKFKLIKVPKYTTK